MKISNYILAGGILMTAACGQPTSKENVEATNKGEQDAYLWLEEVEGEKAMEWVHTKNAHSEKSIATGEFYDRVFKKNLEAGTSKERIVYPGIKGDFVYNYWTDDQHPRGLYRRMSLTDYMNKKSNWETILDFDKLSKEENKSWVFKGTTWDKDYKYCMMMLSNGGSDAIVCREFDIKTKSFVKDGFSIPESKGSPTWMDKNTLLVASDFGEGLMTESGYPRTVKMWKRGTDLNSSPTIFEGEKPDVQVGAGTVEVGDKEYAFIYRAKTFYTSETHVLTADNKTIKLDIPEKANITEVYKGQVLIELNEDWKVGNETYTSGSLIGADFKALMKGEKVLTRIFVPNSSSSLYSVGVTKDGVLINVLENVQNKLFMYKMDGGKWVSEQIETPNMGSLYVVSSSGKRSEYFFTFNNFITPTTMYVGKGKKVESFQSLPAHFDGSKYEVEQKWATSKDGVKIPYFLVHKKGMEMTGAHPTLLYGYGGFQVSLTPSYSSSIGLSWLEEGGVYALANIRGGGEFGPSWHQAALKEKRQTAYNDFHAIAEDLVATKVTSPEHLGIYGGSNGGLLMGVLFTQRPDLYKAVVCAVPLLDMKRYNKLLAGASWMGEYGNPDVPEEWEFISKYSPYHNLKEGQKYPEVFFLTSTKDDRVHPGHARKMVAKMEGMGYKVLYHEATEGGHGAANTPEQVAKRDAMRYSYLYQKLF